MSNMLTSEANFFDEKKEDNDTISDESFSSVAAPPLSRSKQRAEAASTAGLSELSKQLGILQAKNEAQSVEIKRLERQLRILTELQGISVADLRKALEDACANEALGEMQHRVAKLRAELEEANLARQAEPEKDVVTPQNSILEFRAGELEELEEKHQAEIRRLHEQLRYQCERANRLETEGKRHQKDARDCMERLQKEELARASKVEADFHAQMRALVFELGSFWY